MIGDGICDEITNVERCLFDGGDCCREKKSTPLCKICTCRLNVNKYQLKEQLEQGNFSILDLGDFENLDKTVLKSGEEN